VGDRTRTLALAAAVAALVVVLLWLSAKTPLREQSAHASKLAASAQPLGVDTQVEPVNQGESRNSVEAAAKLPTRSAALSELHVEGTVRIASPIGPLGEYMQGSLTYSFGVDSEEGASRDTHVVSIAESAWRLAAREGATVHWRSAWIDGKRFSIRPSCTVVAGSQPVRLLLHPPQAIQLHVVDAQTGEQLDGLEVYRGEANILNCCTAPALRAVQFGEGLASPIALTPLHGVEVVWVRRAGYAWSHVVVDQRENVDRCVALHAVCEARVRIDGPLPPGETLVVIEYFDGEPSDASRARPPERALVHSVRTDPLPAWVTFELPPGRWRARVESDEATFDGGVHAAFETLPGAVTNVVLESRRLETPREPSTLESTVSFEVELLSDDRSALGSFAFLLPGPLPIDPLWDLHPSAGLATPSHGDPTRLVIAFQDVAPGSYDFVLATTQWSTPLIVTADGPAPKALRVPALKPASFAFYDAFSGELLKLHSVLWSATDFGSQHASADRLPGGAAWRVDSHADEFNFVLYAAGSTAPIEVSARVATRADITRVDLEPGASLTVALRDANARVFARHAWWQAIEIVDERGLRVKVAPSVEDSAPFARQAEFRVPRAGRFTVRLPPLNSHHDAPPQVVELASGAVQRLEFQLTALGCR